MTKNILISAGIAAAMAAGLAARSQDPKKTDPMQMPTQTDVRKVTVQGCLERDYLYTPGGAATTTAGTTTTTGTTSTTSRQANAMAPTPYKLTQAQIIKDDSASSSAYGANPTTSAAGATPKDLDLHVAPAMDGSNKVDLDSQINHQVELVGMMSSKDLMSARGQTTATVTDPQTLTLMFKATSVKSLSDKCQ